jgi:energy-coupling factor transporter transmembrane protein EcfT
MKQDTYTVGDKTYSREQLIAFGKDHYPKFYWIARGLGIVFFLIGLLVMGMIGLVMLILNKAGVFDPDFPIWVFYIPLGLFGSIFLAGLICFIVSFAVNTDEKYINYALSYLTNHHGTIDNLPKRDREALERYERLLNGGVITQEEYQEKVKEILG